MMHRFFFCLAVCLLILMLISAFWILVFRPDLSDKLSEHEATNKGSSTVVNPIRLATGRGVKNPQIPVDEYIYTRWYKRTKRLFIKRK